jgi:integration host factor subunit beta
VTKSELIEKISETLKLPAGKAEAIVNTIFDSMVKALERGEGIEIRGFGSFTVRKYKAYEGRNPRTGETVHVAEKRLPFFKVGKDLRERVNAACKPDERLVGGGCRAEYPLPSSYPSGHSAEDTVGARWNCTVSMGNHEVTAYALCSKLP